MTKTSHPTEWWVVVDRGHRAADGPFRTPDEAETRRVELADTFPTAVCYLSEGAPW